MDFLDFLTSIFTNYTLRNVTVGAAVMGTVSGVLGSFALLRKQSLMGDAMSHAALPGIALVFILTQLKTPLALFVGAFVSAWLGALLVMVTTRYTRVKEDSSLGVVLAVFFGLGLVLLSWIQRNMGANQAGLDKFLFGRAAAMIEEDVVTIAWVGAIAIFLVFLFWKEFKLLCFDPDFAATLGFPTRLLDILLTTLIVIGIVLGLQMVGVVLMAALVVAPPAAARQWTDRLGGMVLLSAIFGALAGVSGALISSWARGLSTGPVIVLCASAIALVSLLFAPNRGLLWDWFRRRRNQRRLAQMRVLEVLHGRDHLQQPFTGAELQTLLPFYNIPQVLRGLQREGLVKTAAKGQWYLTKDGITRLEKQIPATAQAGRGEIRRQEVAL